MEQDWLDERFRTLRDRARRQIDEARSAPARLGGDSAPRAVLLLTTRDQRSGEERTIPLTYRPYSGNRLVAEAPGGFDEPPDWYGNLKPDLEVEVEVDGESFHARAHTVGALVVLERV